MSTDVAGLFAGLTVLDFVLMAVAVCLAAWWQRRKGRTPAARPEPPGEMNIAEVCGRLRRLRDSLVEAQLRDADGGPSGDEVHDAIAAIDRAIEAGMSGSPAFPGLHRRASEACEAAAMAQVLGTVRPRSRRRRKMGRRRAPLLL